MNVKLLIELDQTDEISAAAPAARAAFALYYYLRSVLDFCLVPHPGGGQGSARRGRKRKSERQTIAARSLSGWG